MSTGTWLLVVAMGVLVIQCAVVIIHLIEDWLDR